MYLFFDTETNGSPRSWKAPVTQVSNWPRLVQLAWISYDEKGNELGRNDHIIKPDGWTISKSTEAIHGISTARAKAEGIPVSEVLEEFLAEIIKSKNLVAHNMSFDEKIMGAEFLRHQNIDPINLKNKICTMRSLTDFVGIPGKYGNKWPSLSELHTKFFGKDFDNAHNAAADTEATANCFWEAVRLGVL